MIFVYNYELFGKKCSIGKVNTNVIDQYNRWVLIKQGRIQDSL